jgi:acetamidase/formamidase
LVNAKEGIMANREHVIGRDRVHYHWSRDVPPVVEIEPGDVVHCDTDEVSAGQIYPGMPASDLANLDFSRLYPLAGPVYVKGAEPGDVLEVEVLELKPGAWGWTGILPGLGLLSEDFTEPYIRYFDLTNGEYAELRDDIRIPLQPFCGTMGVAPDSSEPMPVLPTMQGGGNIDTRHINVGSKLYLPVIVPGALFSAGDCHAAQGDGEVCVSAIECPMQFSLRFNLRKDLKLQPWNYQFTTPPGSLQPKYDTKGYFVHSAIGPDLMTNSKNAIRGLVEWLVEHKNLSREDAYVLCSLASDLKISQIVDAPNWCVSAYLSLAVFQD